MLVKYDKRQSEAEGIKHRKDRSSFFHPRCYSKLLGRRPDIYYAFVDLEKAIDTHARKEHWNIVPKFWINPKFCAFHFAATYHVYQQILYFRVRLMNMGINANNAIYQSFCQATREKSR